MVGDFNGDGVDTIAVFRDGVWHRDTDGDGRLSKADVHSRFGRSGDLPVVGDFNGDGIDDLGVYRNGTWYIDTNANGTIDATDRVLKLGGAGDQPVVGDFDGDGTAEAGVYHDGQGGPRMAEAPKQPNTPPGSSHYLSFCSSDSAAATSRSSRVTSSESSNCLARVPASC